MTNNNHPPTMTVHDRPPATPAMKPARDNGVEGLPYADIPRLELDQLLEQLRDRAGDVLATQGRLRGLLRANAAVAADLSLPALLRHIVDAARDLLHARYAAIAVLDRDTRLQQFVQAGMDQGLVERIGQLPRGRGVLDLLSGSSNPDLPVAPTTGSPGSTPGHQSAGGFLGVPIHVGNDVFGNLYLGASPGGVFSAEDEQLVTALAATAGVAIANARLLAESEQRRRWLAASVQLTNQLLAPETEQPLMCVTQAALTAADADFATLTVPRGDDEVVVAAASGDTAPGLINRTAGDRSPAGRTIRTGTPVLLTEDSADGGTGHPDALTTGPVMIVALSAGTHNHGAVTIGRHPGRDGFTNADLDMAASFGTHAAVALALAGARDAQLIEARLDDRDRIAFDMHDHVMGELFAIGMGLQGLAAATDDPAHVNRINTYVDTMDRVISTIRTTIFQLQPQTRRRDPEGLQNRILRIADAHTEQLGYRPLLHFTGPIDRVVDESLAADILAVTREALSNCARHAHASTVTISVVIDRGLLTLEIADDGHGIGTSTRSSGLSNMRRRAENHRGTLTVTTPAGGGTRLTWSAICNPARSASTVDAIEVAGPPGPPPRLS